jgi:hypothetical protein
LLGGGIVVVFGVKLQVVGCIVVKAGVERSEKEVRS